MNVEQMSVADLLREGKQAMALAMGSVGPGSRARWRVAMAEIDLRLSVGDLDEDDLEGRVQYLAKQREAVIAQRDLAYKKIAINAENLQFVQEAFNANHPALAGEWGADLSHGAMLLWAWAQTVLPTGVPCGEPEPEVEKTDMKGKRWSFEEKIALVMMVKPGFKLKDAADQLGRTTGGVKAQLRALALVRNCRLTNGLVIGDVVWAERWCGSRVDPAVRQAVYGYENPTIAKALVKDNGWVKASRGFVLPVSGRVE